MADSNGPWFPIIFSDKCDGCAKAEKPRCVEFCSNSVFTVQNGKAIVAHPENCVSGCSACEPVCHAKAVQFPQRTQPSVAFRNDDEELIRKAVCPKCKKTYWTNRKTDVCFDCEGRN